MIGVSAQDPSWTSVASIVAHHPMTTTWSAFAARAESDGGVARHLGVVYLDIKTLRTR